VGPKTAIHVCTWKYRVKGEKGCAKQKTKGYEQEDGKVGQGKGARGGIG
jgi:hypothetical protein